MLNKFSIVACYVIWETKLACLLLLLLLQSMLLHLLVNFTFNWSRSSSCICMVFKSARRETIIIIIIVIAELLLMLMVMLLLLHLASQIIPAIFACVLTSFKVPREQGNNSNNLSPLVGQQTNFQVDFAVVTWSLARLSSRNSNVRGLISTISSIQTLVG